MDMLRLWPRYWSQNNPTSLAWDNLLNAALDEHGVELVGTHHAQVGPYKVWTANWPYAYGHMVEPRADDRLPTVRTRRRLHRMVDEKFFSEACVR